MPTDKIYEAHSHSLISITFGKSSFSCILGYSSSGKSELTKTACGYVWLLRIANKDIRYAIEITNHADECDHWEIHVMVFLIR